jgi:mono/diheme cytochrome c family protein
MQDHEHTATSGSTDRRVRLLPAIVLSAVTLAVASLSHAQSNEPHPGQAPYDRVCKVCHGPEGKGNAAPALVPFEMEVDELLIRVREGGGEMPPISANRVSDDEVKAIASYLTSLSSH